MLLTTRCPKLSLREVAPQRAYPSNMIRMAMRQDERPEHKLPLPHSTGNLLALRRQPRVDNPCVWSTATAQEIRILLEHRLDKHVNT